MAEPVRQGPREDVRHSTARSFAYEWHHFGMPREAWSKNFFDYLHPHGPEFFCGRLVLDAGAGSGRHSRVAQGLGARVVAVDLGDAIDVARRNLPPPALTVEADLERLPFAEGTFDLVMAIGVLHHLPDPEAALRGLVRHVRPNGHLRVYLYWKPAAAWQRRVLEVVAVARHVTVRLPHRLLHLLCVPLAALLWAGLVLPHRLLRRRARGAGLAARLPLASYADYPFGVLVNDQFDRLSAPLERRFTHEEVVRMLEDAGLEDVQVLPKAGWIGEGRRPSGDRGDARGGR